MAKDEKSTNIEVLGTITSKLQAMISSIPDSSEVTTVNPKERAEKIINNACLKAGACSATLSLAPGPWGLATILPDIYKVWAIQKQMVADIAKVYERSVELSSHVMLYCLFKHSTGQVLRDLVVRVGERLIIKRASLRFIQTALQKIGVKLTQRVLGRGISRFLPLVGAAAMGVYSYTDTKHVGKTAVKLFRKKPRNKKMKRAK